MSKKEMTDKEKALNQYFTPPGPVALAYDYLDKEVQEFNRQSTIMEPCVGDGGIANVFAAHGHKVLTNDVDPELEADLTTDFIKTPMDTYWLSHIGRPDWVVTNPPFTTKDYKASDFVKKAMKVARRGVAFLVRSSFLEPCNDRKELLKTHPPSDILILPRISFSRDGKTDSANYHWLIWSWSDGHGWPICVKNVEWYDRADVARYKKMIEPRLVE